jgi:hypothetical protein
LSFGLIGSVRFVVIVARGVQLVLIAGDKLDSSWPVALERITREFVAPLAIVNTGRTGGVIPAGSPLTARKKA